MWNFATSRVFWMPEADNVAAAIRECPFVVVSDVTAATDTAKLAHVLLPATAWGEKTGTVTNSERRISRQRSFLRSPGETRPDWWIISEVARRMGFGDAFTYADPSEIFAEHAALSAFENGGTRDFDIGAFSDVGPDTYDDLAPFQWPSPRPGVNGKRMFADGRFFTPDGKARFVNVHPPLVAAANPAFPFTLNTGRVRDHWHTMTRTGKSARLSRHYAEPFVEIHPQDATRHRIGDADLVRVSTGLGAIIVRALLTTRQQVGSLFIPMHWNDQFASRGRVDVLAAPVTDPHSGQPASKSIPVRIERFVAAAYGFAVLRRRPEDIAPEYWAIAKCEGGWRVEMAFASEPGDWSAFVNDLVGGRCEHAAYHDARNGRTRFACYDGSDLVGMVFLSREPVAVPREWAVSQLAEAAAPQRMRSVVLAGRPGAGAIDRGATVCACFNVGVNDIVGAIAKGCASVGAVGVATQAGTNCGSCRAEIRSILDTQLGGAVPSQPPGVPA